MTTLDYASPQLRQSAYGFLSLVMTAPSIAMVAYVQLEARAVRHILALPPYWRIINRYAWVPGAIGIRFGITGLVQANRKRALSFVALVALVVTYTWWAMPIMFT